MSGLILVGGYLLPQGTSTVLASASPWDVLASLNRPTFAKYIGQNFRVRASSGTFVDMQLVKVVDRTSIAPQKGECFTLVFQGPKSQSLRQDTYLFEHKTLGTFPLFVVPASLSGGSRHYESAFNRVAQH